MEKISLKNSLLILAIALLGLFLVSLLPKKLPRLPEILQAQPTPGTLSLTLDPATIEVEGTQATTLNVSLSTGGEQVSGVDVVLQYDSSALQVNGITPDQSTTLKTFAPLNASQDAFDWTKAINEAENKIEFGAVTFDLATQATTSAFTGTTSLATITLAAKPLRQTRTVQLGFDFQAQSTTDSNLVNAVDGTDILGTANPMTLKIKAQSLCRAAVNLADQVANLNDLLQIVNKGWNSACQDCLEDLNEDEVINLGDLMFVVSYWNQTCPVSP